MSSTRWKKLKTILDGAALYKPNGRSVHYSELRGVAGGGVKTRRGMWNARYRQQQVSHNWCVALKEKLLQVTTSLKKTSQEWNKETATTTTQFCMASIDPRAFRIWCLFLWFVYCEDGEHSYCAGVTSRVKYCPENEFGWVETSLLFIPRMPCTPPVQVCGYLTRPWINYCCC